MGTRYTTVSVSGYNATPPVDDGTVSEANKVKWSTIKTKLPDPLKTAIESIDSNLTTHFNIGPTALTSNTTLDSTHYNKIIQVSGSGVTLTLSDAATLGAGWFCDIISTDTTNSVTLARATASNTINETSADVTILSLQALKVIVNAAGTGFLVDTKARHSKAYKTAEATTMSGQLTMTSKPIIQAEGAAVASAATCDIWTPADGDTVHVTGTTTITSFGTAPQAGAYKRVIFDGALTLTHGANLNLPGAANITTAADDSCLVYADTTTQLDVVSYTKANGKAVIASGAWTPVETRTLSGDSSDQTFTGLTPGYAYRLEISVVKSASNRCNLRFGNSGGVDSGANYSYTGTSKDLTPTVTDFSASGQTSINLVGGAPAGAHSEKIVLEFETDANDNTHVWGFNKGIQNSSFIGLELYINYNGASAFDRVSIVIGAGTWTGKMRLLRLNS